ncbi:MAG: Rpn family recombination-promoting nuclease/putative transposase [Lachnospiraceae bacterium]|nr:Rpn family recombination-promoting nuclease/putative transposase [Lachnospiraceae bacterium]
MTGKTVQEIIDNITVMDDTFFHKLVEDKGFCEELLQVVLGNPNIRLIEATAQKSLRNIRGRSVVLDAHCVDISDKHFDLEMQRKDDDDHQKRVRYNSSNMDTYIAEKGTKFEQIPDIYVIYITKNDFFCEGRTIYHVDRILRETGKFVYNGVNEIYVNTEIDDGSNIAELMKIFKSPAIPHNSKFPRICSGIRNLKEGKGRDEMCALVEEYAEQKVKEAEQKAREAEKRLADRMLKDGKLTMNDISIYFPTLSEDDINELERGEI